LWDIVVGNEKTMPTHPKKKKKWEIKAEKAMYILSIIMKDEFLHKRA